MTIRRDRMGNAEEEFASLATAERPVRLNEHRDLVHRQAHSGNALDQPGQPVGRSTVPGGDAEAGGQKDPRPGPNRLKLEHGGEDWGSTHAGKKEDVARGHEAG